MSDTPLTDAKERETSKGEITKHAHYGWKFARQLERDLADAQARIQALERAIYDAKHDMEKSRIWGGMRWHYNPLPPLYLEPALAKLQAAIDLTSAGE